MRALGLCLLGALCLSALGCTNPGQPPSLDPFLGRTTVPPPGTGLSAPPSPYIQQNGGTGLVPQSRLPAKRTGQLAPEQLEDESDSGWRGADAPKHRLVSDDEIQEPQVEAADAEFSAGDDARAETASYEADVPASTEGASPRTNPIRNSPVTSRASQDGVEVGVAAE